jgi:hypothetical protein
MKTAFRLLVVVFALAFSAIHLSAQSISLGLRGSGAFPTGGFSDAVPVYTPVNCPACNTVGPSSAMAAAKNGFGYGLDAGLQLGIAGVYASFDHITFDCASYACNSDGNYKLMGATAGVKLSMPGSSILRPFVKGGVTFNQLEGAYNGSELKTDRKPGYEVGVGLDIGILGLLSFSPQARYVGQNFKYNVPGISTAGAEPTQGANYYTFDLGLSVHNPLGGMKH